MRLFWKNSYILFILSPSAFTHYLYSLHFIIFSNRKMSTCSISLSTAYSYHYPVKKCRYLRISRFFPRFI